MKLRPSIISMPAVHALLIQLFAFLLTATVLVMLRKSAGLELGVGIAALFQGVIAAAITSFRRLSYWWLAIQFLFPPAVVLVFVLQMPAWIFLLAFLVSLGIYWATIFTRVPLYLSSDTIRRSVAELLPQDKPVKFIDIGSGLGGVVLYLADRRPVGCFHGIELAPLPWLISCIRRRFRRSPGSFKRGDYSELDLSRYDVVFAYLSPVVMESLWKKARAEMRRGTLLLSCEFPVPGIEPDIVLQPVPGKATLFGWKM